MQVPLIITILGPDQPGLVSSLSKIVEVHNANWSESRMAHLAGKFAGILQVSVADINKEALTTDLKKLQTEALKISIETSDSTSKSQTTKTLNVEILCQDRVGIINDVTEVLATLNVNIEELDSTVKEASMSGGMLFCAELKLGLPENVDADTVEDTLEEMSDQFMIDMLVWYHLVWMAESVRRSDVRIQALMKKHSTLETLSSVLNNTVYHKQGTA